MLFTGSFVHGGSERQFVEALRHIRGSKYEIEVGCLSRRGPFVRDIEAMGVPIHEFPITSLRKPSTVWHFLRLVKFLRRKRIELLHAFEFYSDVFAVPAARCAGVAAIASRRSLADTVPRPWLSRLACALAHRVVANSEAACCAAGLNDSSKDHIDVIHNAISPENYLVSISREQLRKELVLPPDALITGMVAALRAEKGHRTFLRAAAMVARQMPEARFVVVGDGPERRQLEQLASELDIPARVLFAGDQRNVPQWLAAMDLAVLASDTESFPNAVLEAMAAGRAVVCTDVGGVPELVDDGVTGYLVPPSNAEAMSTRIVELLRNPALRRAMGDAGRAKVLRQFTPEQMRNKLEAVYDLVLREHRPTARVLQIGNYPPPVCGWSLHTQLVHETLKERGADSRVMDIGPGRHITGRDCIPVHGALDYAAKLLLYRLRGFTFHVHVNGDSQKGYLLALAAVALGRLTGKPPVLTFHAGPQQIYFPKPHGLWYRAFQLLFRLSGRIICNHQPVKRLIANYGVPEQKIEPIPAFSVQYSEEVPAPLPAAVDEFLSAHSPRLFCYAMFRPEFTLECLFEAFAVFRREFPNTGLLMTGGEDVPPELKSHLQRLGIADAVLFAGNLPHAEFLTAVQRSDVFVRTHLRDGVCSSVLEALHLGTPVVAAEDGHRPPSVFKYAPGDADDLLRVLAGVLRDLRAARAQVRPPEMRDNLNNEINLLLAAGSRA
jgi:glycosyltransferase involved in cell wall biosynthesis